MKNRTFRLIIILIGSLVLNIEAAHAGITHKFKVLIHQELSDFQLIYLSFGFLCSVFFVYVVFMPTIKNRPNSVTNNFDLQDTYPQTFEKRRKRIKKISEILTQVDLSE